MGPCFRAHCNRWHARESFQPGGKFINQLERALDRPLRLHGMNVRKARHARSFLIQTRIVLHRA